MRKFKLFFAFLLMAVLSIGQVWGADYTYTFSSFEQGSPVVFNVADPALTITLTVAASGQGNSTKPQWNAGSSQARVYAGGKLTIAIENASIDKLVFDYAVNASSGTKPTITGVAGSTSAGTWDAENKTWEGSDTEVIFSTSGSKGNVGFKSIKVYYTPDGSGSDQPNITASPVSAKYAVDDVATALTITAAPHTSGKTLSYQWYSNTTSTATVDNDHKISGATNYNYTPSTASAGTTYYYCVVSEQDGGSATSSVASIEVKALSTIAQVISDFIPSTDNQEGAEFALNDVTVTYVNGDNIYLKDASGYLQIYKVAVAEVAQGKVLQGLWGKAKTYNKLPEITTITKAPSVTDGTAVEPIELTAFPTSSDVNKYVVLKGVTFASAQTLNTSSVTNITGSFEGSDLTIRNNFKIAASLEAGKSYNVEGIVAIFNTTIQVFPISFEEQHDPTVTLAPNALDFGTIGVGDDAPAALTFTVSGSYLTANLSATVTAGSDYYGIEVTAGSLEKDGEGAVSATITVTPKAAINASAGTKAGTVTISGSGLNETVSLTTEVKAKHDIIFNTGGLVVIPSVSVREGAEYTVTQTPAASLTPSCEFGTFVGWTTADKIADPSVKPTLIANSKVTMATENITLHAVYSKTTGGGGTTEETASVTIGTYATANSWDNDTQYGSVTIDENITATAVTEGAYSGKYFSSGNDWRFYHTDDGILRISAADGCTLKSATLTFSAAKSGTLSGAGGDVTSKIAYEISGSSYDFTIGGGESATKLNGQIKFTVISVTYDKSSGTITYSLDAGCCEPNTITIASGIEYGSVEADKEEACEGKTVTLSQTADPAYHFDAWDVYKTGESATKVTVTSNQFTMPDYAVTVSASFAHDACENLAAPTLNGVTKTYNSATITWNSVSGAQKYAVSVVKNATSEVVFSSNDYADVSKELTGLEPETQYDYSIMAVGDGVEKCADGNGLLEGSFTTAALPTVQLYYVKKQGADPIDGGTHTLGVEFDLVPSDLSCTKTFVGWTDEANKDYTHATDAPSVLLNKYTFTSEAAVTLYAVYAEVGPGTTTYTLTPAASMSEGVYVIAACEGGDDEIFKALTGGVTTGSNYDLVNEGTGFAIDGENKIVSLPNDACEFTFTAVSGGFSIQKPNEDYLGYTDANTNRRLAFGDYSTLVWTATELSVTDFPDGGLYLATTAYKIFHNTTTTSTSMVRGYKATQAVSKPIYLFKKATAAGTATNYATTCADAPVATPDPASIDAAAAGTSGTITMVYDNVNTSALAVALYNDAEGNVAFTGDWLTASLSSTNISYTVNPNTTYAARTAYIKLTAPETTGATDPAVVIIPVTQAKYIPEFASLAALVAADPAIPSGTDVKVSFSHVLISDDIYTTSGGDRKGVYLNQKAANNKYIEIFYSTSPYVPATWVKNGYVSATDLVATWTYFNLYSNDQWELVPASGFSWEDDLVYEAPSAAQISVSPSGDVVFTAVDRGTSVVDKELTVTLTNVTSAAATLTDANSVFSIDNETPATGEKIKISVDTDVEPNTYNAVLTISDNAGVADNVVINISITISAAETAVSTTSKWVAAEAADLVDGRVVLITGVKSDVTYAMSAQTNNNRSSAAGTLSEGVFTPGENTLPFTLVATGEENTYYIKTSNDKYLYNASTSGNSYLRTKAEQEDVSWTITLDGDGNAVITSVENTNRTLMRFNLNGTSTPLFNCYASGQQSVKLYVPKQDTPEPPTPVYTEVRSGLEAGRHYTVCLEKKVTAVKGATFWSLTYKNSENTAAYLVQEEVPFAAGKPYIIQATDDNEGKLEVVYEGDAVGAPVENGALRGTFSYMDAAALAAVEGTVYMLFNNELRPIGTDNHLDAHRAYVLYNLLTVPSTSNFAPGKKVKSMPLQKDVATGMDELNASEAPVKVMIDGKFYILRGEKMYDATGRLVK